jgi:hypothetical protein
MALPNSRLVEQIIGSEKTLRPISGLSHFSKARIQLQSLLGVLIEAANAGEGEMPTWTAFKSAFLTVFPTRRAVIFGIIWIIMIIAWQVGHAIGWL